MQRENRRQIVKVKKRRKLRKGMVFFLSLFLFVLAVLAYGAFIYMKANFAFSNAYKDDGKTKSDLRLSEINPKEDNISILIMGVDENTENEKTKNDPTRTDTLMFVTLNRESKSVKVLSIPRDSYVYIPQINEYSKINHAYAYGKTEATIATVEHLLDLPVDYYMKVNFNAFIDVVDAFDGINVDVPYEFYEQDSMNVQDQIHLLPGKQDLDGEEALALARTRKLDNDIERGKRQQMILQAIIKKATSYKSILKYGKAITAVGDNMTTNMQFKEARSLLVYILAGKNLDIETLTIDGYDYQPGSVYYWQLDEGSLEEVQHKLSTHLNIN